MSNKESEHTNLDLDSQNPNIIKGEKDSDSLKNNLAQSSSPKWINNKGEEVKHVFGFNENAELVNARVAMIGFLMLILTELAFAGEPATQKIFGIN